MAPSDYTLTAKVLHWLIALVIFVQLPLGWLMHDFVGIQKFQAYNFHKSLGITVLAVMILRLIWRLFHRPPKMPASMSALERGLAYLVHVLLYVSVVLMTLTGWAMISVSDKPSVLFQYTRFPLLPWLNALPAEQKKSYLDLFHEAHEALGYVLLALIAIHAAGALRHAILLKDGVFSRMLIRFGRSAGISSAVLLFASCALSLGGAGRVLASEWSVNPEKSRIAFEATGSGYVTKGTFGRYRTEIDFDPEAPGEASVRVVIDMSSAVTGEADTDQSLKSADFFNSGKFPDAQYVAKGAILGGDGKYRLNGRLTLKGVTKPVDLPFSIAIESGTATVNAETTVNRLDFGVGPESVAGLAIDKDVKLTINLTAVRLDN